MLLAFFLVPFSQPNDLSKDLRIEAVALGFLIDFPLAFVELADFFLNVFDTFDDGTQLITRNLDWSGTIGVAAATRLVGWGRFFYT